MSHLRAYMILNTYQVRVSTIWYIRAWDYTHKNTSTNR